MEDDVYQPSDVNGDLPDDNGNADDYADSYLQEISGNVQGIDAKLDDFIQNGYESYDDALLLEKVDSIDAKADQILSLRSDEGNQEQAEVVDYSEQLQNVQELLSYQCGLLVVLSMLVVVVMGIVAGSMVTRWWRAKF